jgi:hypothetical protein
VTVRVDGEVRIPEHKWYQLLDYFTRIDEQLEVLIKQVDYTNKLLRSIATAVTGLPVVQAPAPPQPQAPAPLAAPVLAKTDTITVTSDRYQELLTSFDLVLITPDSDVLIAKSPDEKGFMLYAGAYLLLRKENNSIYVKAVSGTANLYISYWQIIE